MERSPVIVIGMSRSGTTLLVELLEGLGLFAGWRKTPNREALLFRQLNDWLLGQCGGGLENPSSIGYLLRNEEALEVAVDFLRFTLGTPKSLSFLGLQNYIRCLTPQNMDIPWGWKDPRNTFTLPVWLRIFPEARVIHILRNGVDVAASLKARYERGIERIRLRHRGVRPLYWFYLMLKYIPRKRGFFDLRCSTLDEGLRVWEEYVDEARRQLRVVGERGMEIRYEDLLLEPQSVLREVAQFSGLPDGRREIAAAASRLDRRRAYAFVGDPHLEAFASHISGKLLVRGYGQADFRSAQV